MRVLVSLSVMSLRKKWNQSSSARDLEVPQGTARRHCVAETFVFTSLHERWQNIRLRDRTNRIMAKVDSRVFHSLGACHNVYRLPRRQPRELPSAESERKSPCVWRRRRRLSPLKMKDRGLVPGGSPLLSLPSGHVAVWGQDELISRVSARPPSLTYLQS